MDAIFSGERFFFAAGQFPEFALEILSSIIEVRLSSSAFTAYMADVTVQRLSGEVITEREASTILITNPVSPCQEKELDTMAFLRLNYPNVPQPLVAPYHWLSVCSHRSLRLSLPDLDPEKPYFVHPDSSRDKAPLRAWVSVNVQRQEGESAEQARANVVALLECGGALSVSKRAHADVLIVDATSQFYKTVKAEKERAGRDWQRLAERDWVEACVRKQKLTWRRMESEEEDPDSFEDQPNGSLSGSGKGPGRPTGK